MEKPKIRFIDSHYKTLFFVEDGGEIEVGIDGVTKRYPCVYLDETHAKIGGRVYHICEFAEHMERNKRPYRPVEKQEAQ